MSRKSKSTPDDPAESKRFIETARVLESDESDEAFELAFKKIIPPKSHGKTRAEKKPSH